MGVLMLKCPTTGREFSTGIHVEEDSFKRLPETVTKARCPHCDLCTAGGPTRPGWPTRSRRANRARSIERPDGGFFHPARPEIPPFHKVSAESPGLDAGVSFSAAGRNPPPAVAAGALTQCSLSDRRTLIL
jgi:hypothetical protein